MASLRHRSTWCLARYATRTLGPIAMLAACHRASVSVATGWTSPRTDERFTRTNGHGTARFTPTLMRPHTHQHGPRASRLELVFNRQAHPWPTGRTVPDS